GVMASAVAPAKPAITSPLPSGRTLRALPFMMVWPMDTCPSPATTTRPPLRTERMVVPCHWIGSWEAVILFLRVAFRVCAGSRLLSLPCGGNPPPGQERTLATEIGRAHV